MQLLYIFIITINICFSLLLLKNIKKNQANIFFFLTSFGISCWVMGEYFIFTAENKLFWIRFTTCCSSFYLMTMIMFTLNYPKKLLSLNWKHYTTMFSLSSIMMLICSSKYSVESITASRDVVTKFGFKIFALYILISCLLILGIPIYGIFNYNEQHKKQLKSFIIGLFLAIILASVTNVILPAFFGIASLLHLGPIFLTLFTLSTTFSILKYQFIDVTILVNKNIAHCMAIILISTLYISINWLAKTLFIAPSESLILLYSILFFALLLPVYNNFRILLQSTTQKLFLKERYNYKDAILSFSKQIATTFTLKSLEEKLTTLVIDELEISPVHCFFPQGFDSQKDVSNSFISSSNEQLPSEVISQLNDTPEMTAISTLQSLPNNLKNYDYCLNIRDSKNQLIGIIFIGKKLSEDPFYDEDFQLFKTIINNLETVLNQIKQSRITSQMDIAQTIQKEVIPKNITLPNCDVEAYFHASEEVGGDYYDTFTTDNNHWIILGDVSGHGVGSGLVMFMVQSIFNTLIHEKKLQSPADLNKSANNILCKNFTRLSEPRPMTIATLHTENGKDFSCHGSHENIFIYRAKNQSISNQPITNIPLGIGLFDDLDTSLFKDSQIQLNSGDILFLCTDGIIEAENTEKIEFGEEAVMNQIKSNAKKSLNTIKSTLLSTLNHYTKSILLDDISFVIIRAK